MQALYRFVGITRQGFHKHMSTQQSFAILSSQIIELVKATREDHPRAGPRTIYTMYQKDAIKQLLLVDIGRDKFEQIVFDGGLRLNKLKSPTRTTFYGGMRCENMVEGLEIKELDHVWVSDISYFRIGNQTAYLTSMVDVRSRRCLASQCSLRMTAELTVIPALIAAIKVREIDRFDKLIFHSDAGGQYIDKAFLGLLKDHNIKQSMAKEAYENPYAERFNGTIKNDYLEPWHVNSFSQLEISVIKFMRLYNEVRPHAGLSKMSPIEFEKWYVQLPINERKGLKIKMVSKKEK